MITIHWIWILLFILANAIVTMMIMYYYFELTKRGYYRMFSDSISENYIEFELKLIERILTSEEVNWDDSEVAYDVSILLGDNELFKQRLAELITTHGFDVILEKSYVSLTVELKFSKRKQHEEVSS